MDDNHKEVLNEGWGVKKQVDQVHDKNIRGYQPASGQKKGIPPKGSGGVKKSK